MPRLYVGVALRLNPQLLLQGPPVKADDDLPVDHGGRRRLRAEPDQLIHEPLVLGDILLRERYSALGQKLCLPVTGRSPGLRVHHHVHLGHAYLLSPLGRPHSTFILPLPLEPTRETVSSSPDT